MNFTEYLLKRTRPGVSRGMFEPAPISLFTEVPRIGILGSWRSPLAPYSVYPVLIPEACNEYGVLRKTRARLQLREYQVHLDATL
jgi:hypothetical protein